MNEKIKPFYWIMSQIPHHSTCSEFYVVLGK